MTNLRSLLFVLVLFLTIAVGASTAMAQSFYDDEGVPDFEAPEEPEEEVEEEADSPAPRTRDEARERERRRHVEEEEYYWGESTPRQDDPFFVPFSDPYDMSVMNYQFWIGSGALLAGSTVTTLAVVLLLFYPLLYGSQMSAGVAIGLVGVGVAVSLVPPLILTPMAINWVGNRYYPDQYLGAFLGSAAGLTLAVALNMSTLMVGSGTTDFGLLNMAASVAYLAGPAAGGMLGYHMQASSRADRRRGSRSVELMPTPMISSDSGQNHFGLGLSGRF